MMSNIISIIMGMYMFAFYHMYYEQIKQNATRVRLEVLPEK